MVSLVGDEKALRQMVGVLLDNALKYSPPGGAVSLELEKSGKNVILSVENTAEHIAGEELSRMFDRFYRGDQSRSSETGGYGIGLSIAKAVTEAHRGKISASSPGWKQYKNYGVSAGHITAWNKQQDVPGIRYVLLL